MPHHDLQSLRATLDGLVPDARRLVTVDAHTEGEPLRVILAGGPELAGETVRERREDARLRYDGLRTALMWEPRGHPDMYGCHLVPPEREGSAFGVVFMHNAGYSTMCGHAILALGRLAVELGLVEAEEPETIFTIDAPAGPVRVRVRVADGRPGAVSFVNVPSWVVALDRTVAVSGLGEVRYDLAFGGAFYAVVDGAALGFELNRAETGALVQAGRAIKAAVAAVDRPIHPDGDDLSFLYGTIFTGPAREAGRHSRNVCVFADGEVDRSPTGTGVSARLAIHRARGEVEIGQTLEIESIVGSRFRGRILEELEIHGRTAVRPEVSGRSWVSGWSEWLLDPDDPFVEGFLLR